MKTLYCRLYNNNTAAYDCFCNMLNRNFNNRKASLHLQDVQWKEKPRRFLPNNQIGMIFDINAFSGNVRGEEEKLSYLAECGINYLYLMPSLVSDKDCNEGGYTAADFRKVQPEMRTIEDLETKAAAFWEKGMHLCLNFAMNDTCEEYAWMKTSGKSNEPAQSIYLFYENLDEGNLHEAPISKWYSTTVPYNYWLEDWQKVVMTTFYPYQWNQDFSDPLVFNNMTENMLHIANQGINVIRLDGIPCIWKEFEMSCFNLLQDQLMVRLMQFACEIVCPSVLLLGEGVVESGTVAF